MVRYGCISNRQHEAAGWQHRAMRKRSIDAIGKNPATQIDGEGVRVHQFHKFELIVVALLRAWIVVYF